MTSPSRVQLPALASPAHEVWHVILDLAETTTAPWTLVGGQMVLLHALERGVEPPQISQDADVVGDVRSDQQALRKLVGALEHRGFQVDGMSPDGLAHRYRRRAQPRDVLIDVLAPEGLGRTASDIRANVWSVCSPAVRQRCSIRSWAQPCTTRRTGRGRSSPQRLRRDGHDAFDVLTARPQP